MKSAIRPRAGMGSAGNERWLPDERTRPWRRPPGAALPNVLSCDVEDYFQVSAFEHLVPRARWNELECRIPRNVSRVLDLLAAAEARCTFFALGWVAQHHPQVIRRIAAHGHEVASHGMRHVRVWAQRPEEFREDVTTSKRLLEDIAGQPVRGYRAASWSVDERTPWAHDILREAGYEYSSSIYPIAHDHYGMPAAPRAPFYPVEGLLEIPATTARLLRRNWPAAGGGYFRVTPVAVSLWLIRRAMRGSGMPAVFYFHPWELDPDQPRIPGAELRARFRHYVNLKHCERRLERVLASFRWDSMDRVFCAPTGRDRSS